MSYTNTDFVKKAFCEHCATDNSYCMVCEEIVDGIRRPRALVYEATATPTPLMTARKLAVLDAVRDLVYGIKNVDLKDTKLVALIERVVEMDHYEHPEIIEEMRKRNAVREYKPKTRKIRRQTC